MDFKLLEEYQSTRHEITELRDRIEQIYSGAMFPKSVQITDMPRASGYSNDGMVRVFEKIEELTELYEQKQRELIALCVQIEREIENLPSIERRIIRFRYIDGKKWPEVSALTGYSVSNLHKIHAKMKS